MKPIIQFLSRKTTWFDVVNAARLTMGKSTNDKVPESKLKLRFLLAEHSPIRELIYSWTWENLKSWISVHFVRHHVGIQHFVSTQRDDRTKVDRNKSQQDTPVLHRCTANAQAIINISRLRLCSNAHKETKKAWEIVLEELKSVDPELVSVCVPNCVYRGFCYEMKSCGYYLTKEFELQLKNYRKNVRD